MDMRIEDENDVKRTLLEQLIAEMAAGQRHDLTQRFGKEPAPMTMEEQIGNETKDAAKPVDHSEQGLPEGPKAMERVDSPQLKDAMNEGSKKASETGEISKGTSDESLMGSVDEDDDTQRAERMAPKFKLRRSF